MTLPISHYRLTAPIFILLSICTIITQMIFAPSAQTASLWTNWFTSIIIGYGLWDIVDRNRIGRLDTMTAIMLSSVIITGIANFIHIFLPSNISNWQEILVALAQIIILSLTFATWQNKKVPHLYIAIGLIVGALSCLLPHTLFWLLLLPCALYNMRSFSGRNFWSIIVGALLGIWIIYVMTFVFADEASADALILQYKDLWNTHLTNLLDYSFWQWLFIAFIALLFIIYSLSNIFLNIGDSLRTHSSITFISSMSFMTILLSIFDGAYLPIYLNMVSILLTLQLVVHQGNQQNGVSEWSTILIMIVTLAFGIVPLFVPDLMGIITALR